MIIVRQFFYILLLSILIPSMLSAQKKERPIVQFSGFVMSSDSMMGVPFAHLRLKGTSRGGSARADGFFSFAVAEGDTIEFTSLGYEKSVYYVPRNVEDNKLSTIIQMSRGAYNFPQVDIYYWGDRRNFRKAFIDVRPNKDLQERAEENTRSEERRGGKEC